MTKKIKDRIRKGDEERVVLSETLPEEVPVIFSNEGFYKHCLLYKKDSIDKLIYSLKPLFEKVIKSNNKYSFIPYVYKIRKNEISLRNLSLLHPAWQYKFIKFYKDYSSLICYCCSDSKISLRYPKKVASTVFVKNKNSNINKYKNNKVSTLDTELITKHPTSYFSYPCNREYKFFDSEEFLNLEKKYNSFWKLDVSKCFESIYTHSIGWALKSKIFMKSHKSSHTFGNEFDTLMRSGKHNETNGIVIGPEISRIFAEIIFQDIDKKVINSLDENDLIFDTHYTIRRYVDDILVFAKSDNIAKEASQAISIELFSYNLHLNDSKHEKYTKPFFTSQSRIIFDVKSHINEFFNKFITKDHVISEIDSADEEKVELKITPSKIYSVVDLKNNFIRSVKSTCSANKSNYGIVSNYIISSMSRQVIELVEAGEDNIKKDENIVGDYASAILCLIDTMFFFYTVEPSVRSSYTFARTIILATRFAKKELPEYEASIKQRVLELFIRFYNSANYEEKSIQNKETLSLETINILLALKDMGEDYILPIAELKEIFDVRKLSYFEIMSCLYYIEDLDCYRDLRNELKIKIKEKLKDLGSVGENAEAAYILLDSLTCPYLDTEFRKNLLADLNINLDVIGDIDMQLDEIKDNYWFINWKNIDILALLEKKELNLGY